jgi:hypothetical protein
MSVDSGESQLYRLKCHAQGQAHHPCHEEAP